MYHKFSLKLHILALGVLWAPICVSYGPKFPEAGRLLFLFLFLPLQRILMLSRWKMIYTVSLLLVTILLNVVGESMTAPKSWKCYQEGDFLSSFSIFGLHFRIFLNVQSNWKTVLEEKDKSASAMPDSKTPLILFSIFMVPYVCLLFYNYCYDL